MPAPVLPFKRVDFLWPPPSVRSSFVPRRLTDRPQSKQLRLDFFLASSLTAISGFIFDSVSGGALDMASTVGCAGGGLAAGKGWLRDG